MKPQRILHFAIFASGNGTNAEKIWEYFKQNKRIVPNLLLCNNPGAGVLNIAQRYGIPSVIMEKTRFQQGDAYLPELKNAGTDLLILSGFLWQVPLSLIKAYPGRIINIHPALLPKYGGKGMYGMHVHQAVIHNGEKESGITIHLVDEQYDHGEQLFQCRCAVKPEDTPDTLAQRIHKLEHAHFAEEIEKYALRLL